MDSTYDGWFRGPCGGGGGVLLGDIDGSGVPTLGHAILCPPVNGIQFIKPSKDVPPTGRYRQLPPGTEKPTVSVESGSSEKRDQGLLGLQVYPNPASGEVRIEWNGLTFSESDDATIRITDVLGQEVLTEQVAAQTAGFHWDASKTFQGRYFITIELDGVTETKQIDIQR